MLVLHAREWPPVSQTSVAETQCGGRSGCTFGGIIFSMLFAQATREVAGCARSENLSFTLPFDPLGAPWPCSALTQKVEIFDVEYCSTGNRYLLPKIVWPINRVTISGRMVCR